MSPSPHGLDDAELQIAPREAEPTPSDPGIRGECQVCGGDTEHHPNCEVGALRLVLADIGRAAWETIGTEDWRGFPGWVNERVAAALRPGPGEDERP